MGAARREGWRCRTEKTQAVRPGKARGARWDDSDMDDPGVDDVGGPRNSPRWSVRARWRLLRRAHNLFGGSFPLRTGGPLPKQAPGLVLHRAGVASRRHQFGPSWLGRRPNGGSP